MLIESSEIDSIVLSDHVAVHLTLDLGIVSDKISFWRLNEALLQDNVTTQEVTSKLAAIFSTNDSPDVSPTIIWEAHKCVVRGLFLKHGTKIKKDCVQMSSSLYTQIRILEQAHKK